MLEKLFKILLPLIFLTVGIITSFPIGTVEADELSKNLNERLSYANQILILDEPNQSHEEQIARRPDYMKISQEVLKEQGVKVDQYLSLEQSVDWSDYPSVTVTATGYTAGYESTGKTKDHPDFGITFSGVKVRRDLYSTIAADLSRFPIGTILFIPGYGYGVVADKGGAIKGDKLDLYYETVEDVYEEWGKKKVKVYIVEMGEGRFTERDLEELNGTESLQVFRNQYK